MQFIYQIKNSSFVIVNNSAVYLDIPVLFLALTTIIAYIIISVFMFIFQKNFNLTNNYKVLVEILGKQYLFDAICDTGNNLTDTFTSKPVVVCNSKQLSDVLDVDFNCNDIEEKYYDLIAKIKGLRLITYNTIQGSGVIPVIKPEKLFVKDNKNLVKPVDAFVGITFNKNRKEEAIFNPSILV